MHITLDPEVFSQDFQSFLQNNALPCPPVPQTLLPFFKERDCNFFGTADYFPANSFLYLQDLQEANFPINSVSMGIFGKSLQSRYIVYTLHTENLLLGISLGWSRIYADTNFERSELELAFKIARTCMHNMPEQGKLSVLINEHGCTWQYGNNENIARGENLASLLDIFEQQPQSDFELPPHLWIRI